MSIYPLRHRELVDTPEGEIEIYVDVTRDGWSFAGEAYRALFGGLQAYQRLELRRKFEAQVTLAKNTPTKGDT